MPTVRSIGIPVPGTPADAAGLGSIAPWMPADGGPLGQPGQASLEPGQQHPFAAELAAAIAAKQGASTNSGSQGNLPNKSYGQNLPGQVGAQREILAKFAEKQSEMVSSTDEPPTEPSKNEVSAEQPVDSESTVPPQASVPPTEAQLSSVAVKDVTAPVDSKAASEPSEQNSPQIDPELGAQADASTVVTTVANAVSNSSLSVSGVVVNGPINPAPVLAGQSAVGAPEAGMSSTQPATEHALKDPLHNPPSSQPQVQQSEQPSSQQSAPQGQTVSRTDASSSNAPVTPTIANAIRAAAMSAATSSGGEGAAVLAAKSNDSAPSHSAVTTSAALEAATSADPMPTQKAVPAVGTALMSSSSKAAPNSAVAEAGADHTTVSAATLQTAWASSMTAGQSQASQAALNQKSDAQSQEVPSLADSQETPVHVGQSASSRASDAEAAKAAMLRTASASASASAGAVVSSAAAAVHSDNPVTQSVTLLNSADVDGSASAEGRDVALTEALTESGPTVSQARKLSTTTQTGGMVPGQQAVSLPAQGTDQQVALPATGVAQPATVSLSMNRSTTDDAAQDQVSKRVAFDGVAAQSKPNASVPSSAAAVNIAPSAESTTATHAIVPSSVANTGAQEHGVSVRAATVPSVALGDVKDSQVTSNSVSSVPVNAGESRVLPSSMSPISALSVLKAGDAQAAQQAQEQQDIQTAEVARSVEVMQAVQSVATQKVSDQTAVAKTISTQAPAASSPMATTADRESSKTVGEMVRPTDTVDSLGVPTASSLVDRSAQARLVSAEAPSIANALVLTPKAEVAAGNVTGNAAGTSSSGVSGSRASDSTVAQASAVMSPDRNVTVAAPDRASISAAEGSAAAQTLAQVSALTKDAGDSKSDTHVTRSEVNGLPEASARSVAQAASSSDHFQGFEGTGGDANAEDSGQHQMPAKPVTDFGALVRPVTDPVIPSPEGARTVAQRIEAMATAGPSHAEVLARAESRVEAARASLASGPLNVEVLKLTRQGGGRAVLEVTPPNEGPIRLDLKLDGAGRATLLVDGLSEAMKSRLEGSAHFLRQDMAQMGLALNLEMRERQESNAFANAMAFSQGQGGGAGGAGRGDPTKAKSGTSVVGGGNTASSSQSMGSGDGIHFVA